MSKSGRSKILYELRENRVVQSIKWTHLVESLRGDSGYVIQPYKKHFKKQFRKNGNVYDTLKISYKEFRCATEHYDELISSMGES